MHEHGSLKQKIADLIEPIIKDNFLELFDVELPGKGYIRVYIDRPGPGVTVDDCTLMSRKIEEALDREGIAGDNYSLEVSSPGIERPLRKPDDYRRFTGSNARIIVREAIDGETAFSGVITAAGDEGMTLRCREKDIVISYAIIKKANLQAEGF